MANPDRAVGLVPSHHSNGGSWNNALAVPCIPTSATESEHSDYFIGMPVTLAAVAVEGNTEGLNHYAPVKPMIDEDDEAATIAEMAYGVVVGFANAENQGSLAKEYLMLDPTNLEKKFLDYTDIEATGNDWLVYVAPASGWVFKAQTASALTGLTVGEHCKIGPADTSDTTNGDTTTGRSNLEVEAIEAGGWVCVGFPENPDNDLDLANAEVYLKAVNPFGEGQMGATAI
jgi:hypothetical protein